MKPNIEELRKKYMENPPEGLTSQDIRNMSEDQKGWSYTQLLWEEYRDKCLAKGTLP